MKVKRFSKTSEDIIAFLNKLYPQYVVSIIEKDDIVCSARGQLFVKNQVYLFEERTPTGRGVVRRIYPRQYTVGVTDDLFGVRVYGESGYVKTKGPQLVLDFHGNRVKTLPAEQSGLVKAVLDFLEIREEEVIEPK